MTLTLRDETVLMCLKFLKTSNSSEVSSQPYNMQVLSCQRQPSVCVNDHVVYALQTGFSISASPAMFEFVAANWLLRILHLNKNKYMITLPTFTGQILPVTPSSPVSFPLFQGLLLHFLFGLQSKFSVGGIAGCGALLWLCRCASQAPA